MLSRAFQNVGRIERKRITMPDNVIMRLNRLEKPEPWPVELLGDILAGYSLLGLQQYPAYQPFYDRLAVFAGVKPDEIVVGAGIEEHIRNLFMLCAEPGAKVAFLWPTCKMFEIYAEAFGMEAVKIAVEPGQYFSDQDLIDSLPADVRLLILANPGQPVETCYGYGAILNIARACEERGAVLAVDEAYHGFGGPTMIGQHGHHDNMVILRTFSKAFGAASIRLGYAVGGPALINALNAVRQSGEVSDFSMHVAAALMDRFDEYVKPGIEATIAGRDMLRDRVKAELGFETWGRMANHVLIDFGTVALKEATEDALAGRGIYVKANFPHPLSTHMLVTCGGPELMERFFMALKGAL